jgi:hypothetical protein
LAEVVKLGRTSTSPPTRDTSRLVTLDKTVLVAVTGLDSEARRHGDDFMYMTCTEACAGSLKTAFHREIEIG